MFIHSIDVLWSILFIPQLEHLITCTPPPQSYPYPLLSLLNTPFYLLFQIPFQVCRNSSFPFQNLVFIPRIPLLCLGVPSFILSLTLSLSLSIYLSIYLSDVQVYLSPPFYCFYKLCKLYVIIFLMC